MTTTMMIILMILRMMTLLIIAIVNQKEMELEDSNVLHLRGIKTDYSTFCTLIFILSLNDVITNG